MAPHAAFLLPLLSLGTASALASMPTPQLHPQTLQPLFGAEQFVAVHNFLNPSLVSALATDVESLRQRGLANTKASTPAHGSVEWLMLQPDPPPPSDEDDAFGITGRECLFEFVDALRLQIEEQTGVALDAHCELKYAHYPCGGRYQRHVDGMNVGTVSREYSFLLYLNEDWRASDGGWLRAFDLGGDGGHVDVAPAAGTLVVFKSDVVPHEVRPTTARRLAVVGWLHRHVPPPEEVDDADLTPLARAIMEHYRAQGKTIKLGSSSPASRDTQPRLGHEHVPIRSGTTSGDFLPPTQKCEGFSY